MPLSALLAEPHPDKATVNKADVKTAALATFTGLCLDWRQNSVGMDSRAHRCASESMVGCYRPRLIGETPAQSIDLGVRGQYLVATPLQKEQNRLHLST